MPATLYEPINVYKPLAERIGIVDGPLEYLTVAGVQLPMPFTTRMTVIRLADGDLFLHSPIVFDASLAAALAAMGRVRHLVSPNQFHYAHIGEWQKAFPDAVAWASPGARERARARRIAVRFDRDLNGRAAEDWRQEIDQIRVPGGYFGEFVFFHRPSRTLILTDTVMNLEPDKIGEPWRFLAGLSGMRHPRSRIFFGMRLPFLLQRSKARAAAERIRAWAPDRVVLSHGRCLESDSREAVLRIFGIR